MLNGIVHLLHRRVNGIYRNYPDRLIFFQFRLPATRRQVSVVGPATLPGAFRGARAADYAGFLCSMSKFKVAGLRVSNLLSVFFPSSKPSRITVRS